MTESSVEAEFVTTRPVTGVRCFLRYENHNDYKDCKDKLFITHNYFIFIESHISRNDIIDSSVFLLCVSSSMRERDGGEGLIEGRGRGQGNLIHLLQFSWRRRRVSMKNVHQLISLFSPSSPHLPICLVG